MADAEYRALKLPSSGAQKEKRGAGAPRLIVSGKRLRDQPRLLPMNCSRNMNRLMKSR
jgi:hypothetical protein